MAIKKITILAVAAALATTSVFAQDRNISITQDGRPERLSRPISGLDGSDVDFIRQAAYCNMFEIQASELAGQKSQDPFVLEYAKEMIHDHHESLEELRLIAQNKGVSLPGNLPGPLQRQINRLENLSGPAFDNAYERFQKNGHADASTTFKKEIENGRDKDVLDYAVKTLPIVTMHYKMMLTRTTEMGATQMKGGS